MNKFFLFSACFFVFYSPPLLTAQPDSLPAHRTIKVAKPKEAAYLKAFTDFYVYYDNPGATLSYRDYIMYIKRYSSASNTQKLKITDAKPNTGSLLPFDYTAYFKTNHFTQDIKMRDEETEVVRLLVYVTNLGKVKFVDLDSTGTSAEGTFIYSKDRKQFKEDVSHVKTQKAFSELLTQNWQPAEIAALKTHPSQRKNKYKTSKAFSEGVLTVIYSSEPIENTFYQNDKK